MSTYENVEEIATLYLESDDYYEKLATSIKPAQQWKSEHLERIQEILGLNDLVESLKKGLDVIQENLPTMVSKEEGERIQSELSQMAQAYESNSADKTLSTQQLMEISDATMASLYNLGKALLEKKAYDKALSIFQMLAFFNPKIGEYWLGQGIALFHLKEYEQATDILQIAKSLQPHKVGAYVYAAICHVRGNKPELLNQDLIQIDHIFSLSAEESSLWEKAVKHLLEEARKKKIINM